MSHYVESPMKIKDQSALVAGVAEWLLTHGTLAASRVKRGAKIADMIEVHEQAVPLVGYENRARPEHAHVIVRRNNMFGSSNDLGFVRKPDGTFSMIVSDFDQGKAPKIKTEIAALAGVHAAMAVAKRLGRQVERRVDAKGRQQLVVLTR